MCYSKSPGLLKTKFHDLLGLVYINQDPVKKAEINLDLQKVEKRGKGFNTGNWLNNFGRTEKTNKNQ